MRRMLLAIVAISFLFGATEAQAAEPVGTLKAGVVGSGDSIEPVFWGCIKRRICCYPRYVVRVYRSYCPPPRCYYPPPCYVPAPCHRTTYYGYSYSPSPVYSTPRYSVPAYAPRVQTSDPRLALPKFVERNPVTSWFGVKRETEKAEPTPRFSNATSRERSRKYLAFGDALFREQKFHSALQRYKSAAQAAPDLAESYFRQGHALVATNRYDLAAKAFKLGFALSSDAARDGFKVDDLYADNRMAKQSHVEALAESAMIDQTNADLLYLVGLFLHYDGQTDRATKFFVRSAKIAGAESRHLQPFLPAEERNPLLFAAKYDT